MENETRSGNSCLRNILLAAALFALTILVFSGVRHNAFINFDDPRLITQNPRVLAGLSWDGIRWAFSTTYFGIWHPLTWVSLMTDISLFGLNPAAHHLTSAFIHAFTAVLLFVALTRLTESPWRSAIVAAIFAIHPLRVESVAWAAERKDVLCAMFWSAALIAYAQYARKPGGARYALVLAAVACSMLSKPMAVTLPCALLLLDYWPLRRFRGLTPAQIVPQRGIVFLVLEKVPMFAMSLACSVVTYVVSRDQGASKAIEQYPIGLRLENVVVAYASYLGKMLWPVDLAVHYPFPSSGYAALTVVSCAAALLTISVASVLTARSRPYLLVGSLWYLGVLAPAIGFVQVGHRAMADRFTYIPSVGILVAVVWLLADWSRNRPRARAALVACTATVLAAFSFLTIRYVAVWRDSRTLFEHALRISPDSGVAHNNLGMALMEAGDLAGAQTQFEAAVHVTPEGASAIINLGIAKGMQGDMKGAATELERAVAVSPDDPDAHFNLAVALQALGDRSGAAEHFKEALRLRPSYVEAQAGLSSLGSLH